MMKILTVLTMATLLLTVGCQNTVNTVENSEKQAQVTTIQDTRVITDRFLRDRLKIIRVNVAENSDGFLQVQVEALNDRVGYLGQFWSWLTDANPYRVNYKFSWFDDAGMAVATDLSIWKQVIVKPGETINFRSVAPTAKCRDFTLSLQEAE